MAALRILLFAVCVACLMYGLFRETPPAQVFNQSDKVGHILGFAVMSAIGIWSLPRRFIGGFLVVLVGLALSAEFLQERLLPYRHFSIDDLYANLAGIALATLPWLLWQLSKKAIQHSDTPILNSSENHQ
ncbi:hypothetical protein [Amphritea balenae]|uniref:VanZ family protein n=1 Tax=Amphritea balenae TaxID=452629 RepID=A0A3P1STD4_9GAMM|nr:hypothetical protein [Amphritea balenae]RRD00165.1 hypothetical protein EHS89_08140 [Amphritea balenae]GGK77207.1 hypothetical protein GCM10007941_29180 [Amphritea balenae]